jgi:hypothetical protein
MVLSARQRSRDQRKFSGYFRLRVGYGRGPALI